MKKTALLTRLLSLFAFKESVFDLSLPEPQSPYQISVEDDLFQVKTILARQMRNLSASVQDVNISREKYNFQIKMLSELVRMKVVLENLAGGRYSYTALAGEKAHENHTKV